MGVLEYIGVGIGTVNFRGVYMLTCFLVPYLGSN